MRVPLDDLAEGERSLTGDAAHYVVRVLRLRTGDTFVGFDPRGGAGAAEADVTVTHERGAGDVKVRVGPLRPAAVVARRPVTLVQGLAKGDKVDAIVRDATELGATRVIVAACARSVVRLDGARAEAKIGRWEKIAREAARQAGRGDPPLVELASWDEALERARAGAPPSRGYCLWERAVAPLGPMLAGALADPSSPPLAFAVGPEGGLADDEVEAARAHGFEVASLGSIVLRTETVAAVVLGAARVMSG